MTEPIGIATDSQTPLPDYYVASVANTTPFTTTNVVQEFSPLGQLLHTITVGSGVSSYGHLVANPSIPGVVYDLFANGQLWYLNLNTNQSQQLLDIPSLRDFPLLNSSSLYIDESSVYDVEKGVTSSMDIQTANASYGDLAIRGLPNHNGVEVFCTGLYVATPFVLRFILHTDGTPDTGKMIVASNPALDPQFNEPRGIAVNSQGTVLTTLPINLENPFGDTDVPFAFKDTYPEDRSSPPQRVLFNGQLGDVPSQGMTTDPTGDFFIATGGIGTSLGGAHGSGAIVELSPTLNSYLVYDLSQTAVRIDSQDVAAPVGGVYVTIGAGNEVVAFAPSHLNPPVVVAPAALPAGTVGAAYAGPTFTATGGTGAGFTFTESGALPPGLTFNAATDQLVGTPTQAGTFPNIVITAKDSSGDTGSATYTLTVAPGKPFNFDKLGAYRLGDGSWSLDSDGTFGFNAATDQVFRHFSPPGVTGVAGDWTGTGRANIGDFKDGVWHLDLNGNGVVDPSETFTFGQAGDKPVVGDWTGDGKAKLGVFRAAADGVTGEFILDTDNNHQFDASDTIFTFGLATDRIVVGDWTGDGKAKVGVFRDATAFGAPGAAVFSLDTNNNHTFDAGDQVFVFGLITDGLVIGDWNGNGVAKVGVYRDGSAGFNAPGTALFSLDTNGNRQYDPGVDAVFLYGLTSDQFVAGNWVVTPPLQPAEFAAGGRSPGLAPALTPAQLAPVLQQAIAAWVAAGADAAQLQAARVQIGQLDDNLVGWTSGDQITLDATADGWGWNTDPSAALFTTAGADGWQAQPGSPAAGEMDLLTVLRHELGHVLGYSDVDPATHPGSLMASTLPTGTRRMVGS